MDHQELQLLLSLANLPFPSLSLFLKDDPLLVYLVPQLVHCGLLMSDHLGALLVVLGKRGVESLYLATETRELILELNRLLVKRLES